MSKTVPYFPIFLKAVPFLTSSSHVKLQLLVGRSVAPWLEESRCCSGRKGQGDRRRFYVKVVCTSRYRQSFLLPFHNFSPSPARFLVISVLSSICLSVLYRTAVCAYHGLKVGFFAFIHDVLVLPPPLPTSPTITFPPDTTDTDVYFQNKLGLCCTCAPHVPPLFVG